MILDKFLVMSDAQTLSAVGANPSTDYIDTVAVGDDYAGCWFVSRVDTAVTSTGSANVTIALQTASEIAFTGGLATVASTGAVAKATLVAGYTFKVRIPTGIKRYLRVLMTSDTTIATAAFDNFIVKDTDVNAQLIA